MGGLSSTALPATIDHGNHDFRGQPSRGEPTKQMRAIMTFNRSVFEMRRARKRCRGVCPWEFPVGGAIAVRVHSLPSCCLPGGPRCSACRVRVEASVQRGLDEDWVYFMPQVFRGTDRT
jgi:hypothetical protein